MALALAVVAMALAHSNADVDTTSYCCPDAKKCLKPSATQCDPTSHIHACKDPNFPICCPVTKLCVKPGADCVAPPVCSSKEYCCPDAKHCLTASNTSCASDAKACGGEFPVCCPLTKLCVKVGAACESPCQASSGNEIVLETFDSTKLNWKEMNDPVMGGKSTGTFTIDHDQKVGIFKGTCAIVPSLKAPGFITTIGSGSTPDISHCKNIVLNVNSKNDYKGFRFSFGNEHYPPFYKHYFARGYKADFQPPMGEFGDVVLPISSFTDHWDDATGKAITTCADDPKACPTQTRLKNLQTMTVWAEGVEGDVELHIKNIRATDCAAPIDIQV